MGPLVCSSSPCKGLCTRVAFLVNIPRTAKEGKCMLMDGEHAIKLTGVEL